MDIYVLAFYDARKELGRWICRYGKEVAKKRRSIGILRESEIS